MKVLFIGGTGIISNACSRLALERGLELTLLNRGETNRPVPDGCEVIHSDIRNVDSVRSSLSGREFDAVVDWIAYTPDQIERDIDLFRGRTGQFVFISSASAYQTPPESLPVTEETPLDNPYWQYSRDKIACEKRLVRAFNEEDLPVTIVRPSHTYDRSRLPLKGQYTSIHRMRAGKKVVVHGDGSSLWTLTHNSDFARGFVPLLGNEKAVGEAFHITSDKVLTWNQIYQLAADAADTKVDIVHVPSDIIAKYDLEWGCDLLGDKMHSMVFDNSKIKSIVPEFSADIPFSEGIKEMVEWYDADPSRQVVDEQIDELMDKIIADWEAAFRDHVQSAEQNG